MSKAQKIFTPNSLGDLNTQTRIKSPNSSLQISTPGPFAWTYQKSCIRVCKLLMALLFLTKTGQKSLSTSTFCVVRRQPNCQTSCDCLDKVRHSTDPSVNFNSLSGLCCALYFPLKILPNPVVTTPLLTSRL